MEKIQKKDVRLNIKIEEDLKKRFIAVAKANDEDCSKLVRRFVKEYLIKNSQTKFNF